MVESEPPAVQPRPAIELPSTCRAETLTPSHSRIGAVNPQCSREYGHTYTVWHSTVNLRIQSVVRGRLLYCSVAHGLRLCCAASRRAARTDGRKGRTGTSHVALDRASTADPTAHAPLSHRTGRPIMPIAHWRFSRTYSRIRLGGWVTLGCQAQSAEPSGDGQGCGLHPYRAHNAVDGLYS